MIVKVVKIERAGANQRLRPLLPIAGSRYVRAYCALCQDAIRVPVERLNDLFLVCEDCASAGLAAQDRQVRMVASSTYPALFYGPIRRGQLPR